MTRPMMLRLSAIDHGWAVELTNGRSRGQELAAFRGPFARWRAERYLQRTMSRLGSLPTR